MASERSVSSNQTKTFAPATSISTASKPAILGDSLNPINNLEDNFQSSEFASKKWVWLYDDVQAFIKGFVVSEDSDDGKLKVRCDDGSVCF
jgi:hypothetical protein